MTLFPKVLWNGTPPWHLYKCNTQNPKNVTFLSSLCSPPLSSLQSPLISLFSSAQQTTAQGSSKAASASLWFSALRLSQLSTAHLTVSGIRYKIINIININSQTTNFSSATRFSNRFFKFEWSNFEAIQHNTISYKFKQRKNL